MTPASLKRRQNRQLASKRASVSTTVGERMDAAVHLNGLCGDPGCAVPVDASQASWHRRLERLRS